MLMFPVPVVGPGFLINKCLPNSSHNSSHYTRKLESAPTHGRTDISTASFEIWLQNSVAGVKHKRQRLPIASMIRHNRESYMSGIHYRPHNCKGCCTNLRPLWQDQASGMLRGVGSRLWPKTKLASAKWYISRLLDQDDWSLKEMQKSLGMEKVTAV